MDMLRTSVLIICFISSSEPRSVQSTLPAQDVISFPGVHDTVKNLPIESTSWFPPLQVVLNPGPITDAKFPAPEVTDGGNLHANVSRSGLATLEEGTNKTSDHVQVSMTRYPSLRPRPDFLHSAGFPIRDLANASARLQNQSQLIVGFNNRKHSGLPTISKLAKSIRGIYWIHDLSATPFHPDAMYKKSLNEAEKWIKEVKTHRHVVHMETNGAHCGRNYLVKFDDGSLACLKQRHNYEEIQGEAFSYFLADLLQMRHHMPPTVLTRAVHNRLFEGVMEQIHQSTSWDPTKPFIITKYITHLKPLYLPKILHPLIEAIVTRPHDIPVSPKVSGRNEMTGGNATSPSFSLEIVNTTEVSPADINHTQSLLSINSTTPEPSYWPEGVAADLPLISSRSPQLEQLPISELRELVQWSDLVVIDYLLGSLDRIASTAVNLQWHQQMLSMPVHNVQSDDNGNFIFMDNESGLFHGYRLLDQYDKYLQPLLRSFCLFNKSTISAIKKLHQSRNAAAQLMKAFQMEYPALANRLPGIGPKTSHILQKRIRFVYDHITFCEENYFLP